MIKIKRKNKKGLSMILVVVILVVIVIMCVPFFRQLVGDVSNNTKTSSQTLNTIVEQGTNDALGEPSFDIGENSWE